MASSGLRPPAIRNSLKLAPIGKFLFRRTALIKRKCLTIKTEFSKRKFDIGHCLGDSRFSTSGFQAALKKLGKIIKHSKIISSTKSLTPNNDFL